MTAAGSDTVRADRLAHKPVRSVGGECDPALRDEALEFEHSLVLRRPSSILRRFEWSDSCSFGRLVEVPHHDVPILRPMSLPSLSALRKWMPPQTRALSTSSVISEKLCHVFG